MIKYGLFLLMGIALIACGPIRTQGRLEKAETLIHSKPEDAMDQLRRIDPGELRFPSQKAMYALLYARVQEENKIEAADIATIMPAVEFYAEKGTADQRMASLYYLGKKQNNGGDPNAAMISFALAEKAAEAAADTSMRGRLYMAIAGIYEQVFNWEKEKEYALKALDDFSQTEDRLRYNSALLSLAYCHQRLREWEEADSLYTEAFSRAPLDPETLPGYLSNYARMKLTQPQKDPQGALEQLNKKRRVFYHRKSADGVTRYLRREFTLSDYAMYALASVMVGDDKTCDRILRSIQKLGSGRRAETRYWEYRIEAFRGNTAEADRHLIQFNAREEALVQDILSESVSLTLKDHFDKQIRSAEARIAQLQQQLLYAIFGGALAFLLMAGLLTYVIKRRD